MVEGKTYKIKRSDEIEYIKAKFIRKDRGFYIFLVGNCECPYRLEHTDVKECNV